MGVRSRVGESLNHVRSMYPEESVGASTPERPVWLRTRISFEEELEASHGVAEDRSPQRKPWE